MGGKLTLRRGDLMTPGSYDEAFRGCEGIVHCAARVHEARQGAELLPSHLEGTNNVLASAMKAGSVKRFVHTSSEAAVFDPFKLQSSEAVVFSEDNEPGRVYGPVRTDFGNHLIYLHSCRLPQS